LAGFQPNAASLLDLTVFNNQVLFSGRVTNTYYGLWTTDGTASGTVQLTGIPGASTSGVHPTDLTVFGAEVLFNGVDNTSGNVGGLWVTDGTGLGTHEITGIGGAASTGVDPTDMTVFGSEVLFDGVDGSGKNGLWAWNGSTATELVAGAAAGGLDPTDITVFGSEVLFAGKDASGNTGLWVWNGTTAQELTGISGAV